MVQLPGTNFYNFWGLHFSVFVVGSERGNTGGLVGLTSVQSKLDIGFSKKGKGNVLDSISYI